MKKLIFVFIFLILITSFSSAISVIDKLADSSKIIIASKTYIANISKQPNGTYNVELNNLVKTNFLPQVNGKDINWKLDKTIPDLKNSLSFNELVLQYSASEGDDVVFTADVVFSETKIDVAIITNNFSPETFFAEQSFFFGVPFGSAFTVYTPMSKGENELLRQKMLSFSDSKYGIGGNNIIFKFNEFPSALVGKRDSDFVVYSPYSVKWAQKVESNRFTSLNFEFSPAYIVPQKQFWPNFVVDPNESLMPWILVDREVLIKKKNTENLITLIKTIILNTKDKNEIVENVLQRFRIIPTNKKSDSLINQDIADVSVIIKTGGTKLEKAYALREIMRAVGLPSKIIVGTYDKSREYFVAVFTDKWIYIDIARGLKISPNEFTEVFSEQDVSVYSSIYDVDNLMLVLVSIAPFLILMLVLFIIIFNFRSFILFDKKQQEMIWEKDEFYSDNFDKEKKPNIFSRMLNQIDGKLKTKSSLNKIEDYGASFDNQSIQNKLVQEQRFKVEQQVQSEQSTQSSMGVSESVVGEKHRGVKYSLGDVPYDFMEPIQDIIAKFISLNGDFDLKKCSQESGFSTELIRSNLEKMVENKSLKREKVL